MATAKTAKLMKESTQTLFDYTAATDSGDQTVFTVSGKTIFSEKAGKEISIRPDGVVTGRNLLSVHATNDTVNVAACTAYILGVLKSVSATTDTITRPASAVAKINSVTINSSGAIAVVAGVDSTTTAFSTTRGAAGGPPYIPVNSVEIGQIRVVSDTAAAITADEIFQNSNDTTERFDVPVWDVYNLGDGEKADVSAKKNAYIEFTSAVGDPIHTGDTYKLVYARGYTPVMSEISKSVDFKPAENSHSVSSTQVYNGTVGSSSSSLGQAGFTAMMDNGITDALKADADETLVFKFYPNRSMAPYSLTQGILGISTTYPVADQIQAAATISAERKTVNFSS